MALNLGMIKSIQTMEVMSQDTITSQGHLLLGSLGASPEGERSGVSSPSNNSIDQAYLEGLLREREALEIGSGMDLTKRLVNQEIERIQNGGKVPKCDDRKMSDVTKDKSIKLSVKVLVPVKDHPKFNFVGKLLGPKGNSLKRLQEETMTKMAILGRGSMRDKQKEEELRLSGDQKFNHLSDDLHVEVAAVAPPAEAHARIAYALTEIRRYLVPDYNDDIRQEQMREMQVMNSSSPGSIPNGHLNLLNGTISGSEEGSCSPQSNTGDMNRSPQPNESRRTSGNKVNLGALATAHPALRGLNRTQNILGTPAAGKDNNSLKPRSSSQSRRSVLSLLTKARAIQQKEHELISVFHDMPSYFVNEPHNDLVLKGSQNDESTGRNSGIFKISSSPTERGRFRHDPYPRVASLT